MGLPPVAVVIASAGRAELLAETLPITAGLDYPNYRLIVSVPNEDSLPRDAMPSGLECVTGPAGLTAQRNSAIRYLQGSVEYIFFFDDDAIPRADYVSAGVGALTEHSAAMGITGKLLFDGVAAGAPCTVAEAQKMLLESERDLEPGPAPTPCTELYGCNFGVPSRLLDSQQFDERLPLYGWLEDYDFSHRAARFGPLLYVGSAVAVHLGAGSGGRTKNKRLGYSQVVNPYYLMRKGTMSRRQAVRHIGRPLAKNVLLAGIGGQAHDRRGRLRGNIAAFMDIRSGSISPERAMEISS
jgi:hypothetical protein